MLNLLHVQGKDESCLGSHQTFPLNQTGQLPCNIASYVQGSSTPRCGHFDQWLEQILVEPVAQVAAVVVEPGAQLVAVVLGELELALVALVPEEAFGLDHSFRCIVELWSQWWEIDSLTAMVQRKCVSICLISLRMKGKGLIGCQLQSKCKRVVKININDLIIKESDWILSDAIGPVSVGILLKLVMYK